MNKEKIEKYREDFYLDPYELLNKPRRLFTGLRIRTKRLKQENLTKDYEEVIKLIDKLEKCFYKELNK